MQNFKKGATSLQQSEDRARRSIGVHKQLLRDVFFFIPPAVWGLCRSRIERRRPSSAPSATPLVLPSTSAVELAQMPPSRCVLIVIADPILPEWGLPCPISGERHPTRTRRCPTPSIPRPPSANPVPQLCALQRFLKEIIWRSSRQAWAAKKNARRSNPGRRGRLLLQHRKKGTQKPARARAMQPHSPLSGIKRLLVQPISGPT